MPRFGEMAVSAVICCDLDGVVWLGPEPIPGSAAALTALGRAGRRVAYLTNNSSRTPAAVVSQLGAMGVEAQEADVLTSAQSAAHLIASLVAPRGRVLACAGEGVRRALEDVGLRAIDTGPADAVVVGYHASFDYDSIDRAATALRGGALFVATNLDPTYPGPERPLPGAGSLVAAVATAAGREPRVAGKPAAPMAALVRARVGDDGIIVGDRPSTDGAMARVLDWPFALVLSGVTRADGDSSGGGETMPDPSPDFVAADLAALVPQLLAS
ncbi:MAG TPA: HAD-IIA family hydrolase [Acidimicrobiia bacterium]|nr:HAD-IIA family hydrolase [Acidimicrobiia bacterium]